MDTPVVVDYRELYTDYKLLNHELISQLDYNEYTSLYDFIVDKEHTNENNNLYLLFTTADLLEKIIKMSYSEPLRKPIKRLRSESTRINNGRKMTKYNDYIANLTPYLKAYVTPYKLEQFSRDLDLDTSLIEKLNEATDDSEYVNTENYGKVVEIWFADNCNCPICMQPTLRRYAKDNFPVIDLVCINESHTFEDGVKFFQVKSMSTGESYFSKYFDYDDKIIHTGSYKFGKIVHSISPLDDDLTKKVLIGYICIQIEPKIDHLKVDMHKSFLVLPQTHNSVVKKLFDETLFMQEYENVDNYYYLYIDIVHPTITFSTNTNNVKRFDEFYGKKVKFRIPIDYIENSETDWIILKNNLNILIN